MTEMRVEPNLCMQEVRYQRPKVQQWITAAPSYLSPPPLDLLSYVLSCIYQGKREKLPIDLRTGVDPRVQPVLDNSNKIALDERNIQGHRKFMPSGPRCEYPGWFTTCLD